ncbi:MAG: HIT family protein [Candidatus Woesearchaeota archaeon]
MTCIHCETIEKGETLFENEYVVVFLAQKPATEGHIIVAPKRHVAIIEQLEDWEMAQLATLSNTFSVQAFEKLGAHGTNILIQNGVSAGQTIPHVSVHVLPRKDKDGLSLQWEPKQIGQEDINNIADILKEECKSIGKFSLEPRKEEKKEEKEIQKPSLSGKENYMIKAMRRMP